MRSSQRTRRPLATLFTWAAAIFLITALGATAAFAWSGGTLFRATTGKTAHGAAVSSGYRVSRLRFSRHHEYKPPASTPTPTPTPTPAPPPPDTTPPNTSISSGPPRHHLDLRQLCLHLDRGRLELRMQARRRRLGAAAPRPSPTRPRRRLHQFSVRAKDAAGNVDATPAVDGWTVTPSAAPAAGRHHAAGDVDHERDPRRPPPRTSASFSFYSSEAGSTFECKLDSGGWSELHLAEGLLRSRCRHPPVLGSRDRRGRQRRRDPGDARAGRSKSPPRRPTPPRPKPRSPAGRRQAPPRPRRSLCLHLQRGRVRASNASSTAASWAACSSPKSYSGLAVGSHQFSVRATDAAGNVDATPAIFGWTVEAETSPPQPPPSECTTHRQQHLGGPVGGLLRGGRRGRLPGERHLRQSHPQRLQGRAGCHPEGPEPRPGDDRRRQPLGCAPDPGSLRHSQRRRDPARCQLDDGRTQPHHRRRRGRSTPARPKEPGARKCGSSATSWSAPSARTRSTPTATTASTWKATRSPRCVRTAPTPIACRRSGAAITSSSVELPARQPLPGLLRQGPDDEHLGNPRWAG